MKAEEFRNQFERKIKVDPFCSIPLEKYVDDMMQEYAEQYATELLKDRMPSELDELVEEIIHEFSKYMKVNKHIYEQEHITDAVQQLRSYKNILIPVNKHRKYLTESKLAEMPSEEDIESKYPTDISVVCEQLKYPQRFNAEQGKYISTVLHQNGIAQKAISWFKQHLSEKAEPETERGNFIWDQKDGVRFVPDPEGKYTIIKNQ